jgi:ribose 5-phosphate isomerase A
MVDGKEIAARSAVARIRDGMAVGLGSGSTSLCAVRILAARVRDEGLRIVGVPTSAATEREARQAGIALSDLDATPELDMAIDGADQVDARLACIKGYGGALLREKIVARCARRFLVMVDPSKLADVLDKPVPVEILPFGLGAARRGLETIGGRAVVRRGAGAAPYLTDNGNPVLDVDFGRITDPEALAHRIAAIPGVLDHGLFVNLVDELHVGDPGGARVVERSRRT